MSFINTSWWIIPLLITSFSGVLCPAMGSVLITHKRLLQVNLISHCVLPGLALAMALGIDPSIGGVLSGLVGAIAAESLTNKKNQNYEAVMNTILAGSMGLGVLLIPLLGIRIDLEAVLFGDLLTANLSDLLRTLIAFSALPVSMSLPRSCHSASSSDADGVSGECSTSLRRSSSSPFLALLPGRSSDPLAVPLAAVIFTFGSTRMASSGTSTPLPMFTMPSHWIPNCGFH